MGLLTRRGPPAWHPAGVEIRNKCKDAVQYSEVWKIINIAAFVKAMDFGMICFLHVRSSSVFYFRTVNAFKYIRWKTC